MNPIFSKEYQNEDCTHCGKRHPWSSTDCRWMEIDKQQDELLNLDGLSVEKHDEVCSTVPSLSSLPKPDAAVMNKSSTKVSDSTMEEKTYSAPPSRRRKMTCGACGQKGHMRTNRLCPRHPKPHKRFGSSMSGKKTRYECCGRCGKQGHRRTNKRCPMNRAQHSRSPYRSPIPISSTRKFKKSSSAMTTIDTKAEAPETLLDDIESLQLDEEKDEYHFPSEDEERYEGPGEYEEDGFIIIEDKESENNFIEEEHEDKEPSTLTITESLLSHNSTENGKDISEAIHSPARPLSPDSSFKFGDVTSSTENEDSSTYRDLVIAQRAAENLLQIRLETADPSSVEQFASRIGSYTSNFGVPDRGDILSVTPPTIESLTNLVNAVGDLSARTGRDVINSITESFESTGNMYSFGRLNRVGHPAFAYRPGATMIGTAYIPFRTPFQSNALPFAPSHQNYVCPMEARSRAIQSIQNIPQTTSSDTRSTRTERPTRSSRRTLFRGLNNTESSDIFTPRPIITPTPVNTPRQRNRERKRKNQISETSPRQRRKDSSDELSEDIHCVICLDARKNCFLIPCGHVCMCTECCDGLIARSAGPYERCAKCPLCRTEIEGVNEAFI